MRTTTLTADRISRPQSKYTFVEKLPYVLAFCFLLGSFGTWWLPPAEAQDQEPIAAVATEVSLVRTGAKFL